MTNIYDLHDKAFSNVSAFVILKGGERVATVAFKFPKDGAGRLYAYVHWIGQEMVRGCATGYGYDKKSAAVEAAVDKMKTATELAEKLSGNPTPYIDFSASLCNIGGSTWDARLRDAGFTVLQAV